jgi:hypothetical protein
MPIAILGSALLFGAVLLGPAPADRGVSDRESICASLKSLSPRVFGCEFTSGPYGESWLVVRFDRSGLAADYAGALEAAASERNPDGELHRRAFLIQTTAERVAVHALTHDPNRSISAVDIEEGNGPRVIRRETIEACGAPVDAEPSTGPEDSDSLLACLHSVQPSVFTLVGGR